MTVSTNPATSSTIEEARARLGSPLDVLRRYGHEVRGSKLCCPFHDDAHASFSIFRGRDGKERGYCHACQWKGDSLDLEAALSGRPLKDLLPATPKPKPAPTTFPVPDEVREMLEARESLPYEWAVGRVLAELPGPLARQEVEMNRDVVAAYCDPETAFRVGMLIRGTAVLTYCHGRTFSEESATKAVQRLLNELEAA